MIYSSLMVYFTKHASKTLRFLSRISFGTVARGILYYFSRLECHGRIYIFILCKCSISMLHSVQCNVSVFFTRLKTRRDVFVKRLFRKLLHIRQCPPNNMDQINSDCNQVITVLFTIYKICYENLWATIAFTRNISLSVDICTRTHTDPCTYCVYCLVYSVHKHTATHYNKSQRKL